MKTSYLLIALMITACTTEADETVNPAPPKEIKTKTARIADDCPDITVSNGLILANCNIGLGGSFMQNTTINAAENAFTIGGLKTLNFQSGPMSFVMTHNMVGINTDVPNDEGGAHGGLNVYTGGADTYIYMETNNTTYSNAIEFSPEGIEFSSNGEIVMTIKDGKVRIKSSALEMIE